jgi:hypothetical protein
MSYIPDRWVMVKIPYKGKFLYKVFACWYGGFANGDSWKLNSGVTSVTKEGFVYSFTGSSGSVYECHEDCYGTNNYGGAVLSGMIERAKTDGGYEIEIMPEGTDWMKLEYE